MPPPTTTSRPTGPPKAFARGTHRAVAPDATWARIRPLLPRYGITRVADVTGLDHIGIPVFQAVRPGATTVSVSQGKGLTPMAARVSAAMEAIELWHAEHVRASGPPRTADELGLPYDLADLDLDPGSWVRPGSRLGWLTGQDLRSGADVPVPLDAVRLDHTYRAAWTPPGFHTTSNGLASGNTVAEATAHALAELYERDALARLRARPADAWTTLDPSTVPDPDCRALLDLFAGADITVRVIVAEREPACFEARIHGDAYPITFTGAGCHLDPAIALCRALTEAAQSRLTAITGARDDLPSVLYRTGTPPPRRDAGPGGRPCRWDWAAQDVLGFDEDVRVLTELLAERTGQAPIRVVLPSPDGIPVVKVVAPGSRFDARLELGDSGPRGADGTA